MWVYSVNIVRQQRWIEFEGFLSKDTALGEQRLFADELCIEITSSDRMISVTPTRFAMNDIQQECTSDTLKSVYKPFLVIMLHSLYIIRKLVYYLSKITKFESVLEIGSHNYF